MAKKRTRKSKLKPSKSQSGLATKKSTLDANKKDEESTPYMIAIPTDVLYVLNGSSMQHINRNYIKEEVSEGALTHEFTCESTDTNSSRSLRDISSSVCLRNSHLTHKAEQQILISTSEKSPKLTPPSGIMNSISMSVNSEHTELSDIHPILESLNGSAEMKRQHIETEHHLDNERQYCPMIFRRVSDSKELAMTAIEEPIETKNTSSNELRPLNNINQKISTINNCSVRSSIPCKYPSNAAFSNSEESTEIELDPAATNVKDESTESPPRNTNLIINITPLRQDKKETRKFITSNESLNKSSGQSPIPRALNRSKDQHRLSDPTTPENSTPAYQDTSSFGNANKKEKTSELELPSAVETSSFSFTSVKRVSGYLDVEARLTSSPASTIIKVEPRNCKTSTDSKHYTVSNISFASRTPSPHNHRIQNKCSAAQKTRCTSSPASTIIKEEPRSPKDSINLKLYTERQEDLLDNLSNVSAASLTRSPDHCIKNKHSPAYLSRKRRDNSSSELRFNRSPDLPLSFSIKILEYNDPNNSTKSEQIKNNISEEHLSKNSLLSRSNEPSFNHKPEPSLSTSRIGAYDSDQHNSSKSSTNRSKKRRSSGDHDQSRIPSKSKSKYKRKFEREKQKRATLNSNGQEFHGIRLDAERRSPQPSTRPVHRNNVNKWSNIRFSTSPEESPSERREDSDSDYGWEDPAPPKAMPEFAATKLVFGNQNVQKKMELFNSGLETELDLEKIEANKNDLFRAIEEEISKKSKEKLMELDHLIQKKKDDYIQQLFGTNSFDNWDDEPALSNVEVAHKRKSFQSSVNAPLFDTNKPVFYGRIRQIETEYQGRELPPHLFDSIKQEKGIISSMVIKWLMPYYHREIIQSKSVFSEIAREISHLFYERYADEDIIKNHIDNLFMKADKRFGNILT